MKFYYNGKLVRTSKTHDYKYAVLNYKDGTLACSATIEGARREYQRVLTDHATRRALLISVINGTCVPKKGGWTKADVMRWYKTEEGVKEAIAKYDEFIDGLKIVELEARQ